MTGEQKSRDEFVWTMKMMKEAIVAKNSRNGEETDLHCWIQGYREGALVVGVMAHANRDDMLEISAFLYKGMSLDHELLAHEAYTANVEKNPVTGKAWEAGDVQFIYEKYPELADEVVGTSLMFFNVERGNNMAGEQGYKITDHKVEWTGDMRWSEAVDGNIPSFFSFVDKDVDAMSAIEKMILKPGAPQAAIDMWSEMSTAEKLSMLDIMVVTRLKLTYPQVRFVSIPGLTETQLEELGELVSGAVHGASN